MSRPLFAKLEVIWSTPITVQMTPEGTFGRSEGLVLREGAISPNGATVFLGMLFDAQRSGGVLLLDAETSTPDAAIPLPLPMPDPPGPQFTGTWLFKKQRPNRNPGVATLALGGGGEIWLGGSSNHYVGIASDYHSDAYLAKLDRAGRLVWERVYGKGGQLGIGGIAPDPMVAWWSSAAPWASRGWPGSPLTARS